MDLHIAKTLAYVLSTSKNSTTICPVCYFKRGKIKQTMKYDAPKRLQKFGKFVSEVEKCGASQLLCHPPNQPSHPSSPITPHIVSDVDKNAHIFSFCLLAFAQIIFPCLINLTVMGKKFFINKCVYRFPGVKSQCRIGMDLLLCVCVVCTISSSSADRRIKQRE